MSGTNLYKIAYLPNGIDEEVVELARARSFAEAAAVIRDFIMDTYQDGWADCRLITVQLLREPEGGGVGIIYEPSGCEQTFVVEGTRLKPSTETAPSPEATEVSDTDY